MDIHNLNEQEKQYQRDVYMQLDFPKVVGISLGEWKCNRVCRMCPMYNNPPTQERYMNVEVFKKSCNEIGDRKVNLEISAYGETFQHPNAIEYLFVARQLCPQAEIVVATNGSLLDEDKCIKIVESGVNHLSFSLDAGSAESYKWLCKSTDYENVCRNLETLVKIRNKKNAKHLRITTHIIGIKQLEHEFTPFIKRWSTVVDSAVVRTYGNWAGMVDNNEVTPAEKQNIPNKRYPCAWLWYATKIEPNGDVSKCFIHITGDKNPLGNIMDNSLDSIWQGNKMKLLRENHLKNQYIKVEHCAKCIVWSLFPNFWKRNKSFGIISKAGWK